MHGPPKARPIIDSLFFVCHIHRIDSSQKKFDYLACHPLRL
jgi:hypothetical protein